MRLALIPPRGYENYASLSKFHLMLAHIDYPEYLREYRRCRARQDYIVMDNGAAELPRGQSPFSEVQLIDIAQRCDVDELVLPDALHNTHKTINLVSWALLQYERLPKTSYAHKLDYMAVAQGYGLDDVKHCVEKFVEHSRVGVVGLPRLLLTPDYRSIRIDAANWIEETYPRRFKIHLLGTNPIWVREVQAAARYAPHIRSVDTSMPFNYAMAGARLSDTLEPIKRPDQYFEVTRVILGSLLKANIETMIGWANAEAPTR